jgi:hypothetical protein
VVPEAFTVPVDPSQVTPFHHVELVVSAIVSATREMVEPVALGVAVPVMVPVQLVPYVVPEVGEVIDELGAVVSNVKVDAALVVVLVPESMVLTVTV